MLTEADKILIDVLSDGNLSCSQQKKIQDYLNKILTVKIFLSNGSSLPKIQVLSTETSDEKTIVNAGYQFGKVLYGNTSYMFIEALYQALKEKIVEVSSEVKDRIE